MWNGTTTTRGALLSMLGVALLAVGCEGADDANMPAGLAAARQSADEADEELQTLMAKGPKGCKPGQRAWLATNAAVDPDFEGITGGHAAWAPDFLCGGTTTWSAAWMNAGIRDDGRGVIQGQMTVDPEVCGGAFAGDLWRISMIFDADEAGLALPKTELPSPHNTQPIELTDAWEYFILREGAAWIWNEATDEYAILTHRPALDADPFFGLQFGDAANNKNLNFGTSGWFFYEFHAQDGTVREGYGDVNLDLEPLCTPSMAE